MIKGIDFSHWNTDPDPNLLKQLGYVFILHKANEYLANPQTDSQYFRRKAKYTALGFLFGAYCYEDGLDGVLQADKFIEIAGLDGSTLIVLDLEKYANLEQAEQFIKRVFDRCGVYPVLYTRSEYIISEIHGASSAWLAKCPLFIDDPNHSDKPQFPELWNQWYFWQHGTVNIGNSTVDNDVFNGTLEELQAFWKAHSGIVQAPTIPPEVLLNTKINWPIGTIAERNIAIIDLPGKWYITNPYNNEYELTPGHKALHTGIDVVLHFPNFDSLVDAPIYAIADGMVLYSEKGDGTWGWIIVIQHIDNQGNYFYSRYAHTDHINYNPVKAGVLVKCGDQIAELGNADGTFAYHLHFDISTTHKLLNFPNDWPSLDESRILLDYVDPLKFVGQAKQGTTIKYTNDNLNIRQLPDKTSLKLGLVPRKTQVTVIPTVINGYVKLLKVSTIDTYGNILNEYLQDKPV